MFGQLPHRNATIDTTMTTTVRPSDGRHRLSIGWPLGLFTTSGRYCRRRSVGRSVARSAEVSLQMAVEDWREKRVISDDGRTGQSVYGTHVTGRLSLLMQQQHGAEGRLMNSMLVQLTTRRPRPPSNYLADRLYRKRDCMHEAASVGRTDRPVATQCAAQ
jgi:hypothetical protein